MRLEFEPNVTALPLVENEVFDEVNISPDPQVLLKKGISAAQSGDRKLARELLTEVVEADHGSADALMWLASISEYPEELLAYLERVLEIEPDNSKALKWHSATCSLLAKSFVQRGVDSFNNGRSDLAIQSFDQALEYDRDSEQAWMWKSKLADDDGDRVEFLRRVLSINVDNDEASKMLAKIKASRLDAKFASARATAASGDNDAAIASIDALLGDHPDHVDSHILRAHLASDIFEKLNSLEKALAIDPENAVARSTYDFLSVSVPIGETAEAIEEPVAIAEPEPEAEVPDLNSNESFDPYKTITFKAPVEYDDEDEDDVETDESIEMAAPEFEEVNDPEVDESEVTRELVAPVEELIDADHDTVESLPIEDEIIEVFREPVVAEVEYSEPERAEIANIFESALAEHDESEPVPVHEQITFVPPVEQAPTSVACPFCWEGNEPNAFECGTCHGTLTFSDVESLIDNPRVDRETVQTAVTQMEAEWNLREFEAKELIALGIGHFNLKNYDNGIKYLQEASLRTPNDVILSGQINTLVIRLDELRRQNEINDARPKGRTILVVDDSATVRKLISGKLEKSGHTVVCAEDGVQGLECVSQQKPDLVLLDITMPNMDGYEVCRQIRANPDSRDIPVVMISGKDGFFDKVRGRMAGTTAYITKPFGPETLMKALESYLSNGNGM